MAETTCLRAPWVLPIVGPPLRDAWVTVADGRVIALGTGAPPDGVDVTRDLGHAVLMPGLINAHTHLELSWLWGRVPPAAAVGDVANTPATQDALAGSKLHGVVFREVVGFNPADPDALIDAAARDVEAHRSPRVPAYVVPHAPYSVAPDVIRRLAARAAVPGGVCSIHVGESPDEVEFLESGGGAWRGVLDARKA